VPVSVFLTSQAQPLPWIPASAALNLLWKEEKSPYEESIAVWRARQ
jgi:hypothetical protein